MSPTIPQVAVVMAAYNAREWIGEAVESVLAQSMGSLELIVIDDASEDETPQIVEGFRAKDSRVKLLANDLRSGQAAAANRGIAESRAVCEITA